MRSGASFACSSAMRQLFRYWPPRMVSAKCTRQLSRSSTLAIAAAAPPSAITVCALPNSDLQTRPTLAPSAAASMAARNPAPPAPIMRTSCSTRSYSAMLEQPHVGNDARGTQANVQIRQRDAEQAEPCPVHVLPVARGRHRIDPLAKRRDRKPVEKPAHHVTK